MAISNIAQLGQILADNTRVHTQFIHKTSHADGNANDTIDLSMAVGTPKYNAYVGDQVAFTPMIGGGNFGIYTGEAEAGRTKYLTHWWMQTMSANNAPSTLHILDYLGFYALIDQSSLDIQELDNTQVPTRCRDGIGAQMMLVTTTPSTASADFTISYTNEHGVAGRIASGSVGLAAFAGNVITSGGSTYAASKIAPFIPLAEGDDGVCSVQSIQFLGEAGGFSALVLVRPLAQLVLLESRTVTEVDLLRDNGRVVAIGDDAYLNMILTTSGSVTPAILRGGITVVRN